MYNVRLDMEGKAAGGIEIRNLVKTYTAKDIAVVTAIDDMSVVLPAGKMVFITGKSGSGKSSLLNILGLIDGFDSGEVLIDGAEVSKFSPAEKNYYRSRKIGFVFQEYNIIEKYSIGQNIALSLDISDNDQNEKETVERALAQVGLEGFYKRKPNQMSGGQKQRVAIARAIIKDPDIILADEPTGALDTVTSAEIFKILKDLSRKKTVVVVSHDIESARKWGDIIFQMRDGKIIHTETGGDITETVLADKAGAFDAAAVKKHIKSGRSVTIRAWRKPDAAAVVPAVAAAAEDTTTAAGGRRRGPLVIDGKKIKTHLSARQTFKIAGMAMFAGKVRLGITLILCSLVLALFGFSLMFGAFDTKSMVVNEVRTNGTPFITVRPWLEAGTDMLGGTAFTGTNYKTLAYEILDRNGIKYLKKNGIALSQIYLREELKIVNPPDYIISGSRVKDVPIASGFVGSAEFYNGFEKDLERTGVTITGDMDDFTAEFEKNAEWGDKNFGDVYDVPVLLTNYHLEIMRLLSKRDLQPEDLIGKHVDGFAISSAVTYAYKVVGIINYDLTVFENVMAIQKKGDRSAQSKEQNRLDYIEIQKLREQLYSYLNYAYVANGAFDKLEPGFFTAKSGGSDKANAVVTSALPYFTVPESGASFELWERYLEYLGLKSEAGGKELSLTEYYELVKELGGADNGQIIGMGGDDDDDGGPIIDVDTSDAEEEGEVTEPPKWTPTPPALNSFADDTTDQGRNLIALDDNLFDYSDEYSEWLYPGLNGFLPDYMEKAYDNVTAPEDGFNFSSDYEMLYSSYGWMWNSRESEYIRDGKFSTFGSFVQQENAGSGVVPIPNVNSRVPDAKFDNDKNNPYITLILDLRDPDGNARQIDAAAFWLTRGNDGIVGGEYGLYVPENLAADALPECLPLWTYDKDDPDADEDGLLKYAGDGWQPLDFVTVNQRTANDRTFGGTKFSGLAAIILEFNAPVSARYLAVVLHRGSEIGLTCNEIQVSFTGGEGEKHSYAAGVDYNLADTHAYMLAAQKLILAPDVNADTIGDINSETDGIVLSWAAFRALMPSAVWSSYYQGANFFSPAGSNMYNMANVFWYILENEILGKTVYMQQIIYNGDDGAAAVTDIPVKILGIGMQLDRDETQSNPSDINSVSYITKHLRDKLYNPQMLYSSAWEDDILIPYAARGEIERLYDLFGTGEFIRYIKPYERMSGKNMLEIFTSIKNNPVDFWTTDPAGDVNKQYMLTVNSTTINPIYHIDKIFGLFNSIFKIIAVVLIVIMIILLWSFMSFTIKTRTKDIGILISLGASKRDLADIFIIEGGLIAAGQILVSLITAVISKHFVREYMIERMGDVIRDYDILKFGIWQVLTMVAIAAAVTAVSTALPLWGLARKQPVEIIRKIET